MRSAFSYPYSDLCFLLFPLQAPDGERAHKQDVDERKARVAVDDIQKEVRRNVAVIAEIVEQQRHNAVAHQKRQRDKRGKPAGSEPFEFLFCRGQLHFSVSEHRPDGHQDHGGELHPCDRKAHIVHLRHPEVRHEDGRPRKAGRKAEVEINTEIGRPAAPQARAMLHRKADDAAEEKRQSVNQPRQQIAGEYQAGEQKNRADTQ